MRNRRKAVSDVRLDHPPAAPPALINEYLQGIVRRPPRAEPETNRQEVRLEDRLEHDLQRGLHDPVTNRRDGDFILLLLQSRLGWIWLCRHRRWPRGRAEVVIVPAGTDIPGC